MAYQSSGIRQHGASAVSVRPRDEKSAAADGKGRRRVAACKSWPESARPKQAPFAPQHLNTPTRNQPRGLRKRCGARSHRSRKKSAQRKAASQAAIGRGGGRAASGFRRGKFIGGDLLCATPAASRSDGSWTSQFRKSGGTRLPPGFARWASSLILTCTIKYRYGNTLFQVGGR